jgi:hypothetical protein
MDLVSADGVNYREGVFAKRPISSTIPVEKLIGTDLDSLHA